MLMRPARDEPSWPPPRAPGLARSRNALCEKPGESLVPGHDTSTLQLYIAVHEKSTPCCPNERHLPLSAAMCAAPSSRLPAGATQQKPHERRLHCGVLASISPERRKRTVSIARLAASVPGSHACLAASALDASLPTDQRARRGRSGTAAGFHGGALTCAPGQGLLLGNHIPTAAPAPRRYRHRSRPPSIVRHSHFDAAPGAYQDVRRSRDSARHDGAWYGSGAGRRSGVLLENGEQ